MLRYSSTEEEGGENIAEYHGVGSQNITGPRREEKKLAMCGVRRESTKPRLKQVCGTEK